MTNLKAYVVSDSNGSVVVANMTELEVKDAKIEALENEVHELKAHIKSLLFGYFRSRANLFSI